VPELESSGIHRHQLQIGAPAHTARTSSTDRSSSDAIRSGSNRRPISAAAIIAAAIFTAILAFVARDRLGRAFRRPVAPRRPNH
jgi:hypothetical protein